MCRVVVLVGESSSGKDTIYNACLETFNKMRPCVSHTTRPIRQGEIEGETYNFISDFEFELRLSRGEFIETRYYNTVEGVWKYGLSKSAIDLESDNTYIVILDLEGLKQIENYVGKENVISFYLYADPSERLERSLKRQAPQIEAQYKEKNYSIIDEIVRRFKDDNIKFGQAGSYCTHILKNKKIHHIDDVLIIIGNLINM